jgi:hypothetical protein
MLEGCERRAADSTHSIHFVGNARDYWKLQVFEDVDKTRGQWSERNFFFIFYPSNVKYTSFLFSAEFQIPATGSLAMQ